MACAWGSKVNGILTVFAIGAAVLVDLWDILDHRKEGHTMVRRNGFIRTVSNDNAGIFLETLQCPRHWTYRSAFHRLSILFLRALLCSYSVRAW